MNSLKTVISAILILTALWSYKMILGYDRLDAFNQASGAFQWVSSLGDEAYHVMRLGNDRQYYIRVSADKGDGIIDRNGREILPCEYEAVNYRGGEYMAAATTSDYKLFDRKGKEAASFNRISFPYAYAGDRYFIRYGDDHIENWQDGFHVMDAISGETVASYDDCYNAVWLDDGNWYISRTPDVDGAAMRRVLLEPYGPLTGDPQEGEAEAPTGFFADENFEEMFHGKAYRLICQGYGLYVASVVEKGGSAERSPGAAEGVVRENGSGADAESVAGEGSPDADAEGAAGEGSPDADAEGAAQMPIVVLDETGELFQVTDEAALKRIKAYERNGDLVNDAITIFREEGGRIGLAPLNQTNDVIYLDETGRRTPPEDLPGYAINAQHGANKGMQLFRETTAEDGYEEHLYGIKEPSGRVIIPPLFEEIIFLPDTEHILVNGDLGCGIIRLEVQEP